MAKWFEITNEASAAAAKILIYDRIGKKYYSDQQTVDSKEFANSMAAIPADRPINVHINSPGGDVYEGLAVYHQLQARRDFVTVHVDGIAASIASVIAMAGKETRIPKNAMMMIHDPKLFAFGSAASMRKTADVLDTHKKALMGIYHAKTGKTIKEIEDAMSAETWFTGDEAQKWGLADTITNEVSIKAEFDLSEFHNPPENLKSAAPNPQPAIPNPQSVDSPPSPVSENANMKTFEEFMAGLKRMITNEAPAAPPAVIPPPAPAAPAAPVISAEVTNLQSEISNLKSESEKLKNDLKAEKKKVTDFQAAVKEEGGKLSANILAMLGVAPLPLKPDGSPATGAENKSLLQEYNEAKGPARNELVAKFGAYNIANNIRKPAGQS